jgi:hypothetical protein
LGLVGFVYAIEMQSTRNLITVVDQHIQQMELEYGLRQLQHEGAMGVKLGFGVAPLEGARTDRSTYRTLSAR